MSILDIIIIVAGAILVGIYTFIAVRKTIKYRKIVKQEIENGHTLLEAKDIANKQVYKKKKKEEDNKEEETIFED